MPPGWLSVLAWVSLAAAGLSVIDILIDVYVRRYRQHIPIMEAVWPVTALYFGPLASRAYRRWGRPRRVLFQYFAIAPMRGLGIGAGLREAAKADVLSLTAFEVGLFVWMALMAFVLFPEPHTPAPRRPRLLVPDADRHGARLRHRLAGQRLADPQGDQGGDVSGGRGSI